MKRSMKPYELAMICNDIQNSIDYTVNGEDCFYKGEFIGTGYFDGTVSVKEDVVTAGKWCFMPIKPVERIVFSFMLDKDQLNNLKKL